jgi:hypothetical protein
MITGAATMDAALVTLLLKPGFRLYRPVGAVGPHLVAGIGFIQHLIELLAVVHGGIRLGVAADQLVLAVDTNVVLVAVEVLLVLLGPAGVLVFLGILGWLLLPTIWRLARFDRLILFAGVALLGRVDNGGVDDLATPRDVALGIEVAIEAFKQRLDQAGLGERLAKQPYRRGVGHDIFQSKSQKTHEREAVSDQVFDVVIGQIVKRLQHQDLEHHDGIERLAAGIALSLLGRKPHHRLNLGAEALEWYDGVKRLKRIAFGADRLQTLVEIVEAQLPHRVSPGQSSRITESDLREARHCYFSRCPKY